ncbi:glycosyltransferase [Sphingomonas turrisvirgatae]|uniref:Glycosyltransferase n=1 Tax=Sphingomonas turrisvirgatae TaxID=1888892 RepID=A0A1E3LT99_9SPHN|nr:glycosyltransferase [Sphingomonas turrisvirgatae]ODP36050.1 glycosyltransferase [Sphingomonas turrisvirgatae]
MPQRNRPADHILSFAQTLNGGGVERALLRMAAGWAAASRRVTLVIGKASGALAHELPPGVALHELGDPRYRALLGLPALVRALAPDVVFCPGNHYTAAACWLRARLDSDCPPIVGKVSNALVRPDLPRGAGAGYRLWLRGHRRFLDAVVAMTPAMAREAADAMALRPDQIRVIANPPALPIPGAAPPPMPPGRFILGVGRLAPQKRWDRLIEALPRLHDRGVTLLLLGEGEERDALARLIDRTGLHDRVSMPGHAPDPLPAIARASAVVLTSEFEGVPGVLREAIALGTPVVATDSSSAIPELIDSPAIGTIVPVGDRARLVGALNHWLAPGRPRPEPRVETGPDPIAAYLALFDELAAQRRR